MGDNRAAVALYDRAITIFERLVEGDGWYELANNLAQAYIDKAVAVSAWRTTARLWLCTTAPSRSANGW